MTAEDPEDDERQPLFDIDSLYASGAWDTDAIPGRAGSGLLAVLPLAAIAAGLTVAASLWLLGGWIAWAAAGTIGAVWLLFTVGAVWQIVEMRRAGGYTSIPPPGGWH